MQAIKHTRATYDLIGLTQDEAELILAAIGGLGDEGGRIAWPIWYPLHRQVWPSDWSTHYDLARKRFNVKGT